jgi:hypothetical protein
VIRDTLATATKVKSYRETAKLVGLGEDKLSQRVFMAGPAVMREATGGQVNAQACRCLEWKVSLFGITSSLPLVSLGKGSGRQVKRCT